MWVFSRTVWPLLERPVRRRLALAVLAAGGLAVLEALALLLVLPVLQLLSNQGAPRTGIVRLVGERLPGASDLRIAAVLGTVAFVAFVVKGLASLLYLRWNLGTLLSAEAATSSRLLRAYLRAPYTFHLGRGSADLQKTVHDSVRRIFGDALVGMVGASADVVVMAAVAVVIFAVEPITAICAGVYFVLVAIGYQQLIHRRASEAGNALIDDTGRGYLIVQQSVTAVKTVKVGHHEEHFASELRATKDRSAHNLRTLLLLYQAPRYYLEIALIVGVGMLAAVLFSVRSVTSATSVLGLFLAAGFRLLPSLNRVLVALSGARSGLGALQQVSSDLQSLGVDERGGAPSGGALLPVQDIRFEDVRYSYSAGPPVLTGVDLRVFRGTSVAFVGLSGAGKTTLLDVVLGLLQPTGGVVLIDGRPLGDVLDDWQRSVGYVPQETVILDASIRENIAFGETPDQIDDDAVALAAERSELTELVAELPEGFATRLHERGTRLSGGQRQRIGIARALYRRPTVLVLDEATSSLDVETEARITRTIDALAGDLTILIVTHRLSTVRHCDQIHVLDQGRAVAHGTYEELRRSSDLFARMLLIAEDDRTSSGAPLEAPTPGS